MENSMVAISKVVVTRFVILLSQNFKLKLLCTYARDVMGFDIVCL